MTRLERSQRDDYALMEGVAASDEASLRSLIQRYSPTVIAICRRMLHSHTDAEDVAAEVFAELWFHRDRYDASRGAPRAYICLLARSRSLDKLRKKSPSVENSLDLLQELVVDPNRSSEKVAELTDTHQLVVGRSLNCRCRSEKPSNLHFLVA